LPTPCLMEGLALILATFGIAVSVLEPSPVRTAFLRNAGGLTRPAADDPYAALLGSYNATRTGVHAAGQAVEDVADVIAASACDPRPLLRYQSSPEAGVIVFRKLVDPTGDSIIDATPGLLHQGIHPAHAPAGAPA
jgi:NAD(P)-dependent dehydrogenase (short-subunit alcohol dehydrogenase family)